MQIFKVAYRRVAASPQAMPPSAAHASGVTPAAAEGDFYSTNSEYHSDRSLPPQILASFAQ